MGGLDVVEEVAYVILYTLIPRTGGVSLVAPEDFLHGHRSMAVSRELVLHLCAVYGLFPNFALAFASQLVADGLQQGQHHTVLQVVASHKEVRGFGCESQLEERIAQRLVRLASLWKSLLQAGYLSVDTMAQLLETLIWTIYVGIGHRHGARQV